MRVLEMATMFGMGGISRHVLSLGGWLRQRGHDVHYAGSPGLWLDDSKDARFLSLDVHRASGDRDGAGITERFKYLAFSARGLRRWLQFNPVDVIHAHESAPALVARLAAIGGNLPIVVTYHGSQPARARRFGTIAKRCADKIVCVSNRSAEDLATVGGVPRSKLQVIGLGLAEPPDLDPQRILALRRQLLGDDGRVLVTTIARLTEQKGIDILIKVARLVVSEQPDVRFAIVGDGPLAMMASTQIKEAGLQGHVQLLGRSEEPHLHLAAADMFLLTSRWEALPFTIAEAFQAGLPAIATDCGGVTELVDDSVGRVLRIGDIDGLSKAVLSLARDPGMRASMAVAALARSHEDRFQLDHNHKKIEALYRKLVDSHSHGA
ncbi:MAG: glycosyltransferase family 4 protein [Alphaproteobacteria bacterium]|nr:glycosyltransferase family 4 protein [Alphaproteobacteria bacterium]